METNVEQPSLGFEKLFKRAKSFYSSQSRNMSSSKSRSKNEENVVEEGEEQPSLQRQEESIDLSKPFQSKSLVENNNNTEKWRSSKNLSKQDKSKYVNDILSPEAAMPEIRSEIAGSTSAKMTENLSQAYRPESSNNYNSYSNTISSNRLKEIINNSIIAAVENLTNETNSQIRKKESSQEQNIVDPAVFNQFSKSCQNKENLTNGMTQYSHQLAVPSVNRSKQSGDLSRIYPKNVTSTRSNSKRSYNSHEKTASPRQSPTRCMPSSKSVASSVICHQSISKYKSIACPYRNMDDKKSSKSSKSCKPCGKLPRCKIKSAPCSKACRHVKSDNRKMTGNVNIYICSEGNDAGSKENNNKKQRTESSCNSMTLSNASCVCSSTDVCVCPSTSSSSKTIRDLMDKRKKVNDHVTLKCICGKLAPECDCLNDNESKNITETEEICVCSDVSSFNNPTTSNDRSCINLVECDNRNSDSPSSPRDDFATRITNSRSSAERESYCDRENCDVFNKVNDVEIYDKKTKLKNGNSGRGDAVMQECRCCDTSSDYSDVKLENRVCSCCSDLNDVEKRSVANNREICNRQQSNVNYSRTNNHNNTCNCCAADNESIIYTICRNKEVDRSVCCRNVDNENVKKDVDRSCNCCKIDTVNKEFQDRYVLCKNKIKNNEVDRTVCRKSQMIGKSQIEVRRNQEYLTKPCESVVGSSVFVENDKRRTRYSNSCIMEEDEDEEKETCDASNCKAAFQKQQNSCKFNDFYTESQKFYPRDSDVVRQETNTSNERKNSSELIADGGLAASQTIAESKRMSVADVVKSFSINADKSTSSNLITTNVSSPVASLSKTKEIKASRGSSLKSQFIKAKSFLSGKSYSGESKKDKLLSVTSDAKSREASEEFDQSNFANRSSSDGKKFDQKSKSGSKNAIIAIENSSSLAMDAATLQNSVSLSNSAKRSSSGSKNSDVKTNSGSKNAIIANENSSSLALDAATLENSVSLTEKDKKSLSETIKEFGKSNSEKRSLSGGKNSDQNTNSGSKNAIIANENSSSLAMDAAALEKSVSLTEKDKKSLSETIKEFAKSNSAKLSLSGGKKSDKKSKSGSKNGIIANENSSSFANAATGENSVSLMDTGTGGNSLVVIKSSVDSAGEKSKQSFMENSNKRKSSSSKLGSLIAERKNSAQSQSAVNETPARYYDEKRSCNDPCCCGSPLEADVCTCKQEDCVCNVEEDRKAKEKSCKICKQSKRLCCCCCEMKNDLETDTASNFRVCTLCCRAEKDCCCCNSEDQTATRRSRSPSNSYRMKKSQICLYCEKPRENCACRAPVNKCSCCCMPMDVCNCQNVVVVPCNNPCSYDDNLCQCNGRVVQNTDNGDQQNICVTAWKPRREIRKYFSRNNAERDNPDCPCCETMKPYGSDELPYQRLSVFSDVMTELQQKMSELACCNGCGKIPCCCCNQESKNPASNEGRMWNAKQRKSRSRSPAFGTNPCKCGGRNVSSYQICDRCRTTPCRCRKSRSTQRKPHAKCCYCKSSPYANRVKRQRRPRKVADALFPRNDLEM